MKISDIVKGTDSNNQIVKYRHDRSARRQIDLLESIVQDMETLRDLSQETEISQDLDVSSAVERILQAVKKLKLALVS